MGDKNFKNQYLNFLKEMANKEENKVNEFSGKFVYQNFVTFSFGVPTGMNKEKTKLVESINEELANKLHSTEVLSDEDKLVIKGANRFINSKPEGLINPNKGTMLHMAVGPTARANADIDDIKKTVGIMINLGANLDSKDKENRTPAQLSAHPDTRNNSTIDLLKLDEKKQITLTSSDKINRLSERSVVQDSPKVEHIPPKGDIVSSIETSDSSNNRTEKASIENEVTNTNPVSKVPEENSFFSILENVQHTLSNTFSVFLPQDTSEDTLVIRDSNSSKPSKKIYENISNLPLDNNQSVKDLGNLPTPLNRHLPVNVKSNKLGRH